MRALMLSAVATVTTGLFLSGCGSSDSGGSGGAGGGGGGGGGGGSTATRNAAIQSALTTFAGLHGGSVAADNQAMLNWFKSNPNFANAQIVGASVVAHTTDGVTVAMLNNRHPLDDGSRSAPPGATRLAIEMPKASQARIVNNFGGGNAGISSQIASMVTKGGYTASSGSASSSSLGGMSGLGVFYIDSHGLSLTEDDGKDTYYLMASEVYDPAKTATYDVGLRSHFFSVLGAKTAVRQPDGSIKEVASGNYAISDRYASANWGANTFSQNSLVFINACSSAKTALFKNVCFAKGASVYAGWSGDVDNAFAVKVAPFLFDRLLGANKFNVESGGPQRPFDYTQAAADMPKHGLTADVNGVTLSMSQKPSTEFGLLTPTISYMGVDEIKGELTVNGVFGTDEGKVTVGGTELAIKSWGFNSIICDLPPSISGDTIVEVRSHKSNVVQLTEWRAHFRTHLDIGLGTLKQDGFLDVNFRADIHSHRDEAHQKPFDPIVPFNQEKDSIGRFNASGIYSAGGVTTTWQGSSDLPPRQYNPTTPNLVLSFGSIDAKQMKLDIALEGAATNGMTVTIRPPGSTSDLPGTTGFLDGDTSPGQPVPGLHLSLNPDFSIPAGVRDETENTTHFRLEWDKIVPKSPPDATAARSPKRR
jgi:hypothetical protein